MIMKTRIRFYVSTQSGYKSLNYWYAECYKFQQYSSRFLKYRAWQKDWHLAKMLGNTCDVTDAYDTNVYKK